jgi:hypothetical protein
VNHGHALIWLLVEEKTGLVSVMMLWRKEDEDQALHTLSINSSSLRLSQPTGNTLWSLRTNINCQIQTYSAKPQTEKDKGSERRGTPSPCPINTREGREIPTSVFAVTTYFGEHRSPLQYCFTTYLLHTMSSNLDTRLQATYTCEQHIFQLPRECEAFLCHIHARIFFLETMWFNYCCMAYGHVGPSKPMQVS